MPLDSNATVLLAGIVGSTAYGLAGPDSDIDRLGTFAVPTAQLLGLHRPTESVVSTKPDSTLHEVGKAVRLWLSGNPTASELLWLPEDLYETVTPLGREAIALRGAFVCAPRVKDAYLGYATQQLRKMLANPPGARTAKHARHLMRLVDQGLELYRTGELRVRLDDPERYREFGIRCAADPQSAAMVLAKAETDFADSRPAVPEQPDEAAANDWLLRVRHHFYTPPGD